MTTEQRAANRGVPARITEYLSSGGLWNPELMDHDAVRSLLIDARDVVEIFERKLVAQRSAIYRAHLTINKGERCLCIHCEDREHG
jgi:hypothetical protein